MRGRCAAAILFAAAVPAGTASGHADQLDRAAWTACETGVLADACAYTDHDENVYRGSCRSMSGTLLCVRNRPIERRDAIPEASGS